MIGWVSVALLAGALDAGAGPAPCAYVERSELNPIRKRFGARQEEEPIHEAQQSDLVEPLGDVPVMARMSANYLGNPEWAVAAVKKPGAAKARVVLRRYPKENLWVAAAFWIDKHPQFKKYEADGQRAFLKALGDRKVEQHAADLDDEAFAAVARVWSMMLDRTRPDGPTRVIVRDGESFLFRDHEREAVAHGRSEGSRADQLIELAKTLSEYTRAKASERKAVRERLVAATAKLESDVRRANECDNREQH